MKKGLLFAIGVPLLLVVGYKLMYPTYVWHQKLTIEVQVGDEVRSASSVSEASVTFMPQILPDAHERKVKLRGEALVLDIPGRGTLFALLTNMTGIAEGVFRDRLPRDSAPERYSTLARIRDFRNVPPDRYPLQVTFGDIADPKTVRSVDPANLAAAFGPGASLRRITLEITDEKVTEGGVERALSWWCELRKARVRLSGKAGAISDNELSNILGTGAFRIGDCT